MKRSVKKSWYMVVIICMLMIALSTCLTACSGGNNKQGKSSTYTITKNNILFTVDREKQTISDGTNLYKYEADITSGGYSIDITYPNGSTYWWNMRTGGNIKTGSGGWSDDYDETLYVAGDILCDIVEIDIAVEVESQSEPKNYLVIIFLIIVGIFNLASPETAWKLEYGWRYKNAEPSDAALEWNRFGGIVAIVIAVFLVIA